MGRLDAALARFSAALDALESRVGGRAGGALAGGDELAELRQERDRLLSRISALEQESTSLAGLTQAVESRLDGAIAEIRAALGRS
jgi:hypothetical protein